MQWRRRRAARRWQRWSEVAPEDDFARRAGVVTAIFVALMILVFALIVIGLVFAVA